QRDPYSRPKQRANSQTQSRRYHRRANRAQAGEGRTLLTMNGVVEWWNTGVMDSKTQYSDAPRLQHSISPNLDAPMVAVVHQPIEVGAGLKPAHNHILAKEGNYMASNGNLAGCEVLISSDSHVMEPPNTLKERVAPAWRDQAPVFPVLKVGESFQTHPGGSDPNCRIT